MPRRNDYGNDGSFIFADGTRPKDELPPKLPAANAINLPEAKLTTVAPKQAEKLPQNVCEVVKRQSNRQLFEQLYMENLNLPKKQRLAKITEELLPRFNEDREQAKTFVEENFARSERNRKTRMVKQAFLKAYSQLMDCKAEMIADSEKVKSLLCDTSEEEKQIAALTQELNIIAELVSKMIRENAHTAQNQEEYSKRYDELTARYEKTKAAYDKAVEVKNYKRTKALQVDAFIANLKNSADSLPEWSDDIRNVLVESATVRRDGTITFKFKNGTEIME